MEEICFSVAAKVTEYLVGPAIRQGQYIFCVRKIIKDFESKKKELALVRDSVHNHIKEAKKKTEKIENAVRKWMDDVSDLMEESDNLEKQMIQSTSCFQGWYPNWTRYCLSKQMFKMTKRMSELINNSKFVQISRLDTLPGIEYFSSGNFMFFESTKFAYHRLLEAIQDESSRMIGLYGMGGSGKTTLVKEVGKRAKKLNLFDQVVFVTVSQTPNIRRIQGEIADLLGLRLIEETEAGRAQRISMRLQIDKGLETEQQAKSKERILIILDDVWAMLKLEDIGILLDDNHQVSKVLLTTRRLQVCTLMDCQIKIQLNLLSEEEAWTLFQKCAVICDEYLELLNGVAQQVASECKGLPIAIEAVGTTLKGKSVDEWKVALQKLRDSKPIDVEEGVRDVFTCLQLSYDYLRSSEAKSLFLMSSMFPEDHDIFIDDLFMYGVGLGVFGKFKSLDQARSQVFTVVKGLIDSCLLLQSQERKDCVRMHDMVRDVALWISCREGRAMMVNAVENLSELVEDEAIKDCYALSSWYKMIDAFPHQLDAPKLEILLLCDNRFLELPLFDDSFKGVKELKVLAISNYDYFKNPLFLPLSSQFLTNIRTLKLKNCQLGDISFVASQRRLEILDLEGSHFKELPKGIEKLKKLKLLNVSMCTMEAFSLEVVGRCSQLEELYAFPGVSYSKITYPGGCNLDHVTFPKLQRYQLQLGQFPNNLVNGKGYKNTKLWLHSCVEIEYLVDATYQQAASFHVDALLLKLVSLKLSYMHNLKEVWHGPPVVCFFEKLEELQVEGCPLLHSMFVDEWNLCNLKTLKIVHCPKLTSLFPLSVVWTLVQLQELTITRCNELKHIVDVEDDTNAREETVPAFGNSCLFPNLKILNISCCGELESIFPIYTVHQGFMQLRDIVISNCSKLKLTSLIRIYPENYHLSWPSPGRSLQWALSLGMGTMVDSYMGQPNWNLEPYSHIREVSHGDHQQEIMDSKLVPSRSECQMWKVLQNLRHLELSGCEKLKFVFHTDVCINLPELRNIIIFDCEELEEIVVDNEESQNSSNVAACLPKLRIIQVVRCNKLKTVFSTATAATLQQLKFVHISDAAQLEEIFKIKSECNTSNINRDDIVLPNLRNITLIRLPSLIDISQRCKLHAVNLDKIMVSECPKFSTTVDETQVAYVNLHRSPEELIADKGPMYIMVHLTGEDFSMIENVDPDKYSYVDMVSDVHRLLRINSNTGFSLKGSLSEDGRMPITCDDDLRQWFHFNSGNGNELHLFVDVANGEIPESGDEGSCGGPDEISHIETYDICTSSEGSVSSVSSN